MEMPIPRYSAIPALAGGGAFNGSARVHAFVDLPGDRALMSVIIKRLTYRMMIVIIA
jgi:hypothetical protein